VAARLISLDKKILEQRIQYARAEPFPLCAALEIRPPNRCPTVYPPAPFYGSPAAATGIAERWMRLVFRHSFVIEYR
jgi:hypothetical protein